MSFVDVLLYASLVLLVAALLLPLVRLMKGPTALDRAVAVDVFAAAIVAVVAVVIVLERQEYLAALLIVFVLTAFFSTVSVARFLGSGQGRSPRRRVTPGQTSEPSEEDSVQSEGVE